MEIRIKGNDRAAFEWGDVKKIAIYGGGKILFEIEQSYLEEYTTTNGGTYTAKYDGRVVCMYLAAEPKRALKENLFRNDNYYMKFKGKYAFESGKALYIHCSQIQADDDGEKIAFKTENETNYLHAFTLTNAAGFVMRRANVEKIPNAGKEWTIPDGGKWGSGYGTPEQPIYDTFDNKLTGETGVMKKWHTYETITELPTAQRFYTRTEYSENRKRARQVADICNKNRVFYKNVSMFEIEKLLNVFELIEKKGGCL